MFNKVCSEIAEIDSIVEKIKQNQDFLLDRFDPNNKQLMFLLKDLSYLENEFKSVQNELQTML